jgi:hypothetical protein
MTTTLRSLGLALLVTACAVDPMPTDGQTAQAITSDNPVTYHGGSLIAHPKVVAVFWGPYVHYQSELSAFYAAWLPSDYFDWLAEYDAGTQTIGRGSFAGAIQITPTNTASTLANADVEKELLAQIGRGVLPPQDANTIYAVHFPPSVQLTNGYVYECEAAGRLGTASYALVADDSSTASYCMSGSSYGSSFGWYPPAYYGLDPTVTYTASAVISAVTQSSTTGWFNDATGLGITDECEDIRNPVHLTFGGTTYAMPRAWSNAHHTCYAPVWASDFAVGASAITIASGGAASASVPTSITYGSSVPVYLSAVADDGWTVRFASSTAMSGTSDTLQVNAPPGLETGTHTINVYGTAESHTWIGAISVMVYGLVANGDFEQGSLSPWTTTGHAVAETTHVHDGSVAAYVGGSPSSTAHTLSQVIAVPSTGTTTLSYWLQPMSNCAYTSDRLQVRLLDASGTVVRRSLYDACTHLGWTQMTADLTPFAGSTLTLQFRVQNASYANDYTYLYVDGVKTTWTQPSQTTI